MRSPARPASLRRRLVAALVVAVGAAVAACGGGSQAKLEAARHQLERGHLDRVLAILEDADGAEAQALRGRVEERRDERGAALAELEEFRRSRADRELAELLVDLRALLARHDDPVVEEWIQQEMSTTSDWVAERNASRPRTPRNVPDEAERTASVPAPAQPVEVVPETLVAEAAGLLEPDVEPDESDPPEPGTPPAEQPVAPETPTDPAAEAHRAEVAGDLERAARLWRGASAAAEDEGERARAEHRAWALERRLELRSALADRDVDWAALEPSEVPALLERAEGLSPGAAIGGCLERLRGSAHPATEDVHEAALDDLAALVDEGALAEEAAWRVLAAYRREPVPEGGYRHVRGEWLSRPEQEAASLRRKFERLVKGLARADRERRAELAEELTALAGDADEEGRAALAELLRSRGEDAIERMSVGLTWRKLEEVARAREELDGLRERALALIADEDRYFYPYNPPADPGKSYADYVSVQREISEIVDAVRALWEEDVSVDLPSDFRESAGVLAFVLARPAEWRGALEPPADWPSWYAGVDLTGRSLRLQSFAWTAAERDDLRRDEAVIALSAERWEAAGDDGPDIEERRAFELTNDYRRMLGRRALAWDARLHTASAWHSTYMAETGNFGHEEPDRPGRVTLFDRMEAAGYTEGWNENCQAGTEWARRAFDSWRTSSEHHRNLVSDVPREVAVARAGTYWTMNFGRGNDFEDDLEPWRD